MSIKFGVLKAAKDTEAHLKKCFSVLDLREHLNEPDIYKRLAPTLNGLCSRDKYLRINKKHSKTRLNAYELTASGLKALEKNKGNIATPEEISEYLQQDVASRGSKIDTNRVGKMTMNAISGISEMIDFQDKLIANFRSINSQTAKILREYDEQEP